VSGQIEVIQGDRSCLGGKRLSGCIAVCWDIYCLPDSSCLPRRLVAHQTTIIRPANRDLTRQPITDQTGSISPDRQLRCVEGAPFPRFRSPSLGLRKAQNRQAWTRTEYGTNHSYVPSRAITCGECAVLSIFMSTLAILILAALHTTLSFEENTNKPLRLSLIMSWMVVFRTSSFEQLLL